MAHENTYQTGETKMKKLTKTQQKMIDAINLGSWNEGCLPKNGKPGMLRITPRRMAATLIGENRSRQLITAEILAERGLIKIDYTSDEIGQIAIHII